MLPVWSSYQRTQYSPPLQPETIPGDIIFVVQQKEHSVFKRKGACPALACLTHELV